MDTEKPCTRLDPFDELVEAYLKRRRRGEQPTPAEYAARYPELAQRILELFPALELMERLKPTPEDSAGLSNSTVGGRPPGGAGERLQRLGDYTIVRELGSGGMGIVYEAERESLKNRVALKVMHRRFRADPTSLRRFQNEARSAAKLHHTNIVPVFDYGEHDGVCYYAMQYIAGVGLERILKDVRDLRAGGEESTPVTAATESVAGPLAAASPGLLTGRYEPAAPAVEEPDIPAAVDENVKALAVFNGGEGSGGSSLAGQTESVYFCEVARLGAQVADALDYAHRQGVVHRDIKPSNLLLDAQGNVWVTDFGLAKLVECEDLSQSHDLVGTLRFMAPERFRGITDRRSDIYALGATLYEFLTLQPAFAGSDQAQLIDQVTHEPAKPLRQHDRHIPRDLETLVLKALAKDPKDRFAAAGELRDELRRYLESRPIRSRSLGAAERFWRWCKRNPGLAAANIMAALLTFVLAIAAWIYYGQRNELRYEKRLTEQAERQARLALGKSLLAEGAAVQRSGLIGQRFDSHDRLNRAAQVLLNDPEGRAHLPALRDAAIAAMGLTDLQVAWRRQIGEVMSASSDRPLERYAFVEARGGETVVRRLDDDRELVRLPHPGVEFWHAVPVFSPDGQFLVVCYYAFNGERGDTVDVWHLGRRERVFRQPARCTGIAWHPDGRRLVFAPLGTGLIVWDLVEGREAKRLPLDYRPSFLCLDPKGRRVAANAAEHQPRQVRILDLDTGRPVTWSDQVGDKEMSWSQDGCLLAIGHHDGRVFIWDVERGRLASVLRGHTRPVVACQFAPAGHLLVTRAWDGTVRLWDAVAGDELVSAPAGDLLGFSADGRRLAFSDGPKLGVWDVAHGQDVRTFNPDLIGNRTETTEDTWVRTAQFSPDGRFVALATPGGVHLYDTANDRELARLKAGKCDTVLFDPNGQNLITYGAWGLFRWPIRPDPYGDAGALRVGPPELLREATPGKEWFKATWLPDHRTLAMIDIANARVLLVDASRPRQARIRARVLPNGSDRRLTSIAVSPDGRWAAAGGWGAAGIYVWDLPRCRLEQVLRPRGIDGAFTSTVAFSPDGRRLIASTKKSIGGGCYFWKVGTWEQGLLVPQSSRLGAPVHSPDDRLMALSVSPEKVRLAESATGRAIAHFSTLQPLEPLPMAFSPDGTKLIASTNRETALIWDLRRIRERLREMDLDWDQPPFPPEGDASTAARPAPVCSIRVLGEVLEPRARRAAERAALDERLRADPDDAGALIDRGGMRLRASRWSEAISDLDPGLRIRPDDPDAPILLAEAYLRTNNLPRARAALDRHLARWPDDLDARLQHGLVTLQLRLPQVAADDFTRVLEADPAHAMARYRRARALLSLGRFEDARADFAALIRSDPQNAFLYELRGEAHERLGRHEEARADRQRAAETLQAPAERLNGLAWELATGPAHLRDPEQAVSLARKAVAGARASDQAKCLNTLGVGLYRAGRFAEAIDTLERSLATGKGHGDAFNLYFLAMARFKLGQFARARADFDSAAQWRRGHLNLPAGQPAELDDFLAEAQAVLNCLPLDLPDDVFAPVRPGRP